MVNFLIFLHPIGQGSGHDKRPLVHGPVCSSDQPLQREDLRLPLVLDDHRRRDQRNQLRHLAPSRAHPVRPASLRAQSHRTRKGRETRGSDVPESVHEEHDQVCREVPAAGRRVPSTAHRAQH